jgi:hypothetical protein
MQSLFTAWWLLYVPPAFNIQKFCILPTQSTDVLLWISEQKASISPYVKPSNVFLAKGRSRYYGLVLRVARVQFRISGVLNSLNYCENFSMKVN